MRLSPYGYICSHGHPSLPISIEDITTDGIQTGKILPIVHDDALQAKRTIDLNIAPGTGCCPKIRICGIEMRRVVYLGKQSGL